MQGDGVRRVVEDWYYSPSEGEIAVDVTDLSGAEILLVEKEIDAEFTHNDPVDVLHVDDLTWWIYTGVKER